MTATRLEDVLKTCVGCAAKAPELKKCSTCRTFDFDAYYCSRVCQVTTWPRHKVTHAIGAALRAVEEAASEELEAALRGLLNVITENGLWVGSTVSWRGQDRLYIKPDVHIQMLRKIGEDPLRTAQARRMAVEALAALLPFSDGCFFNIGMDDRLCAKACVFPSLSFARWWYGGMRYSFDVSEMRCVELVDHELAFTFYRKGERGGQWHGVCKLKDDAGSIYDGEWGGTMKRGYGKSKHADGTTFEGEWLNGLPHGQGRLEDTAHGTGTYDGEFREGKKHGRGRQHKDTGTYDGEWWDGEWTGQGKLKFPDGGSYEGQWKNGLRHGHGHEIIDAAAGEAGRRHAAPGGHALAELQGAALEAAQLELERGSVYRCR